MTKLIEEVVDEDSIDTIVEVEDAIAEVEDDIEVEAICGFDTMKKSLNLQANHKKSIECSRTNSQSKREREREKAKGLLLLTYRIIHHQGIYTEG